MLKLSDNEYLPKLTAGYSWAIAPSDEHPGIVFTIRFSGIMQSETVYQTALKVPSEYMNKERIKEIILRETKSIASMQRMWNPEFATMVRDAVKELTPPKDAPEKPQDGPRVDGDVKIVGSPFRRLT